jgi:hypothetical protein|tara:strand:- start:2 stop:2131 length:2130 start_codon:yes stop_codon:yes gene_type:complete
MTDDATFDAESVFLEDQKDDFSDTPAATAIIEYVKDNFGKAEDYRYSDEQRWLQAYRNYRGIYSPDVQFTETEKSRVFIKVTKTKTLAAYGQVVEVLLAANKFPISVDPTIIPEGIAENVHFDPAEPEQVRELRKENPYGFSGDGEELPPGATQDTLIERLGATAKKLVGIENIKEGQGKTPSSITLSPAAIAAKKMEKLIHDQLQESGATKHLRSTAFEMSLFGTGIMKGPFAIDKEYPNWDEDGVYSPTIKTVPQVDHVSVWNFFPDPDANSMDDARFVVERHKMSRSQMRDLKKRPFFREDIIEKVITIGESYNKKYWEHDLEDYAREQDVYRFEVLEYWGAIDTSLLKEFGVDLPASFKEVDEVGANIWICNNNLLRVVLNPFKPQRIPYVAAPYELNPYSFFGIGIAENMDDTQTLMNGFMRMSVDNAVLSGNLLIEVDETNLVPGQDLTVYPGKVFRRQGGAPGQAIFGTKYPNVSSENMMMFDKARQLADESTGLPSFSYGQTGITGVGRTASGISMLMGAAAGGVKTVIKNVDDYLLRPLGEGLFQFNMQFNFDPSIRGDLEVKAGGTESLMANEVRSQRLMQFLSITSNPSLAPFSKFQYIIREIAKSLDLDPDKVTNNMDEAAIQAEVMKGLQADQPQQQQPPGPAGANPMDTAGTGDGTIGTGQAPVPGEQGFTGNAGGTPPQAQAPGQQPPPVATLQ